MDVKRPLAKGSIRFSLGRYNADGDIEYVVERLPGVIQRLRGTANAKTEVNGDIAKSRRAVSASA
jgi:cysteine sulfinate desulfinase/cysteine desulfurase-like protein